MKRLKQRIANPMTVIAIFATLSETSAAISLPFLDNKDREIYIWFLIGFPFYLLLLFFATLNFNYRSLYSPSDFEKDKNFIKVMNREDRLENDRTRINEGHPAHNAQAPPSETDTHSPLPHHICLPERLKDLYVIDARWIKKNIEFTCLMENIQRKQGKLTHVIVFLTCTESEMIFKENAAKKPKHTKKHSHTSYCIAYNLNSQDVTVIDQHVPGNPVPVTFADQSEKADQGGSRNSIS